jgi:hypothetical protein
MNHVKQVKFKVIFQGEKDDLEGCDSIHFLNDTYFGYLTFYKNVDYSRPNIVSHYRNLIKITVSNLVKVSPVEIKFYSESRKTFVDIEYLKELQNEI